MNASLNDRRAAPLRTRQSPASSNLIVDTLVYTDLRRIRRRGPRSRLALLRRALPKRCRTLPGMTSGESGVAMPVNSSDFPQPNSSINSQPSLESHIFPSATAKRIQTAKAEVTILMINIRCLRPNLLELEFHLQTMRPHIVFLQETWLMLLLKLCLFVDTLLFRDAIVPIMRIAAASCHLCETISTNWFTLKIRSLKNVPGIFYMSNQRFFLWATGTGLELQCMIVLWVYRLTLQNSCRM